MTDRLHAETHAGHRTPGEHDLANVVALVPLNRLTAAKSRLSSMLSAQDRAALVGWLAGRVLAALHDSGVVERIFVLSPDPRTLALLPLDRQDGLTRVIRLRTNGTSLNSDLEQGRATAREQGAGALLVVLGDLPVLTAEAVRRMLATGWDKAVPSAVVLAGDRAGRGTNLLLARPADALPFAFGEDSLSRHLALARSSGIEPQIFTSEETSFDVDTPADLEELMARGLWMPSETTRRAVAG